MDSVSTMFVCAYDALQNLFGHAGDAGKTMRLRRTYSLGIFYTLFIIITMRGTLIQVRIVSQSSFRYRFWAILSQKLTISNLYCESQSLSYNKIPLFIKELYIYLVLHSVGEIVYYFSNFLARTHLNTDM